MIPLLLGVGAALGGYLVASNWKDVENWLMKELLNPNSKLKTALKDAGINDYAEKIFANVNGNKIRFVHKIHYKKNGKWSEKTTVREIDESEVPAWAKEGLTVKEKDVTERYAKELSV